MHVRKASNPLRTWRWLTVHNKVTCDG